MATKSLRAQALAQLTWHELSGRATTDLGLGLTRLSVDLPGQTPYTPVQGARDTTRVR